MLENYLSDEKQSVNISEFAQLRIKLARELHKKDEQNTRYIVDRIHANRNITLEEISFIPLWLASYDMDKLLVQIIKKEYLRASRNPAYLFSILYSLFLLNYKIYAKLNQDYGNLHILQFIQNDIKQNGVIPRHLFELAQEYLIVNINYEKIGNFKWASEITSLFCDIFSTTARRSIPTNNITYENVIDAFVTSSMFLSDNVKPWPTDRICLCGKDLNEYMYCECGYVFDNFNDNIFTELPVRNTECPVCKKEYQGFSCDNCKRIYSWFLEEMSLQ